MEQEPKKTEDKEGIIWPIIRSVLVFAYFYGINRNGFDLVSTTAIVGLMALGVVSLWFVEDIIEIARRLVGWILDQIRRIYFKDPT